MEKSAGVLTAYCAVGNNMYGRHVSYVAYINHFT